MGVLEGQYSSSIYVSASNMTHNSATVAVYGLSTSSSSYDSFCVYYQVGGTSPNGWEWVYAYPNGSSYYTQSVTIYGLPSNSAIYFVAGAKFSGQWYYGDANYAWTTDPPSTDPDIPSISLNNVNGKTIKINVSTGANTSQVRFDYYEPINGSRYQTVSAYSNSNFTHTFNVPNFNMSYKVDAQAIYGSKSSGWSNTVNFTSGDSPPKVYMESPTGNTNTITVVARATSDGSAITKLEGWVSGENIQGNWSKSTKYPQDPYNTENISFVFNNDGYGLKFKAGSTYYFQVRAFNSSGQYTDSWLASFTPTNNRPEDFSWGTTWVAGEPVSNLKASQWNKFTQAINNFRVYKGLIALNFISVNTGQTIYASEYNSAIDAISGIPNRSIALPSKVSSGEVITAYKFNEIVRSLNSVDK